MVICARWIWWPGGYLYGPDQGCVGMSPDGVERVSTTLTGFSRAPSVIGPPWGIPDKSERKVALTCVHPKIWIDVAIFIKS